MFSPVYSTLVAPSDNIATGDQQSMVNAAGSHIDNQLETTSLSYYHKSWAVIGILTLNGDVEKASQVLDKTSCDSCTSSPTKTPTAAPVDPPTKSPTIPEGCYSNDYKHCLTNEYIGHDESCTMIWLPNGAPQNVCTALWGECTNGMSSCCEPATCHGDLNYAYCIPPPDNDTDAPTKAPTHAPTKAPTDTPTTASPTSTYCIVCDNEETSWMKRNDKDCISSTLIDTKCNKSTLWVNNKYCRLSCYNAGNGYDGDVCCNGTSASERFRRNLRTSSS